MALIRDDPGDGLEVDLRILYFGTPVVLLSTLNEDGSTNLAPMSSAWALGRRVVLGLGPGGKSLENLRRHGECVLNLPDASLWRHVEAIAPFTGKDPVPEYKAAMGFRVERDKFTRAGLTPEPALRVRPARVKECLLKMEARVEDIRAVDGEFAVVLVHVVTVWAHSAILRDAAHVDPRRWNPLIYNFRHYFGLGPELGRSWRSET